jgi:hypothetical protein
MHDLCVALNKVSMFANENLFQNLKLKLGFSFIGPMFGIQNLKIYLSFDVAPLSKLGEHM